MPRVAATYSSFGHLRGFFFFFVVLEVRVVEPHDNNDLSLQPLGLMKCGEHKFPVKHALIDFKPGWNENGNPLIGNVIGEFANWRRLAGRRLAYGCSKDKYVGAVVSHLQISIDFVPKPFFGEKQLQIMYRGFGPSLTAWTRSDFSIARLMNPRHLPGDAETCRESTSLPLPGAGEYLVGHRDESGVSAVKIIYALRFVAENAQYKCGGHNHRRRF